MIRGCRLPSPLRVISENVRVANKPKKILLDLWAKVRINGKIQVQDISISYKLIVRIIIIRWLLRRREHNNVDQQTLNHLFPPSSQS